MKKNNTKDFEVIFLKDDKEDAKKTYSVIVSRYNGRWVYCRHKDRTTYEVPGGHIESGESPYDAAKRELFEETGAIDFHMERVCTYGVKRDGEISYGVLFFAEISKFGDLPDMEIAETIYSDKLPDNLTYPLIQPYLFRYVENRLKKRTKHKNKKYKAILFDLDGTIFDNFGAVDKSINGLYNATPEFHKMPFDRFRILYMNLQDKYFDMFRTKELTWKQQRTYRMKALYSHFGLLLDDDEAYERFLYYLDLFETHWGLLDNTYELLEYLKSAEYKIGMVTNGELNQQIKKMESQDIYKFFDCLTASSEYDFAKPQKEIFDIALRELGVSSDEAIFIGDSMRSDICGARNANIDSVFIIREHNAHYTMDCEPSYTIKHLRELLPIIE